MRPQASGIRRGRVRLQAWLMTAAAAGAMACAPAAPRTNPDVPVPGTPVTIAVTPVLLDPADSSKVAIGDFAYAGGLALTSAQTDLLHGLSDVVITGTDRLMAVGDEGVVLRARLVHDRADRLVGIADARVALLAGEDGKPLSSKADADAEGLAVLANGDYLVSFERRHRVWLYPASGAPPRPVPSPTAAFPSNGGMEALGADPGAGTDAYVVGAEETGETWTCRLSAPVCIAGPTIDKPDEFGLVAITRLPGARTAVLLRTFDRARGNRIALQVFEANRVIGRLDMARPMTIDNFEGLAAVPRSDGRIRFYLLSDDNVSTTQRTLLLAFDWQPR
jgi:hypothetical protein